MRTKVVLKFNLYSLSIETDSSFNPSVNKTNYTANTTSLQTDSSEFNNKKGKQKKNGEKHVTINNQFTKINQKTRNYNELPVIPAK